MGIVRVSAFIMMMVAAGLASAGSVLDSGQSASDIAREILYGAEQRYKKEQVEKNQVIMYATNWCGYCRKARYYFRKNGIKYKEYNIETSREGRDQYNKLGGKGVPLIVIGGKKIMRGFSEKRFQKLYSEI